MFIKPYRRVVLGFVLAAAVASECAAQSFELLAGDPTDRHWPSYTTGKDPLTTNTPGSRQAMSLWHSGNSLYMFGGLSAYFNSREDMWRFDLTNRTWQWIAGSEFGAIEANHGEMGVTASTNTPGSRHNMATWTDDDGNLYLFGGGQTHDYASFCDMWKFNVETSEWVWVNGPKELNADLVSEVDGEFSENSHPTGTLGAAFWKYDGKFYLYGGIDPISLTDSFSDLWCYDPSINQWKFVSGSKTKNTAPHRGEIGEFGADYHPGGRVLAAFDSDSDGNLWLYGGFTNFVEGLNADLWKFNTVTSQWAYMGGIWQDSEMVAEVKGDPEVYDSSYNPPALQSSILHIDADNKLLLTGGRNKTVNFGAFWSYDIAGAKWGYLRGDNSPQTPYLHKPNGPSVLNTIGGPILSASAKDANGCSYIFGGYTYYGSTDCLWKIDTPVLDYLNHGASIKVKVKENEKKGDSTKISVKGTFADSDNAALPPDLTGRVYFTEGKQIPISGTPVGDLKLKFAKPPKPAKPGKTAKPPKPSKYSGSFTVKENLRGKYVAVEIDADDITSERSERNNVVFFGPIQ